MLLKPNTGIFSIFNSLVCNTANMLLLDLLPELIAQIFEEIVLGGDLDIALMMRLVCSEFMPRRRRCYL
jgi:hypothetical protein